MFHGGWFATLLTERGGCGHWLVGHPWKRPSPHRVQLHADHVSVWAGSEVPCLFTLMWWCEARMTCECVCFAMVMTETVKTCHSLLCSATCHHRHCCRNNDVPTYPCSSQDQHPWGGLYWPQWLHAGAASRPQPDWRPCACGTWHTQW